MLFVSGKINVFQRRALNSMVLGVDLKFSSLLFFAHLMQFGRKSKCASRIWTNTHTKKESVESLTTYFQHVTKNVDGKY